MVVALFFKKWEGQPLLFPTCTWAMNETPSALPGLSLSFTLFSQQRKTPYSKFSSATSLVQRESWQQPSVPLKVTYSGSSLLSPHILWQHPAFLHQRTPAVQPATLKMPEHIFCHETVLSRDVIRLCFQLTF